MAEELIKLDQWGSIAKLNNGSGIIMPFVQELFLLECEIAGTGFVKNIDKKAKALTEGTVVSLVREADNKYDKLAIRIDNAAGEKLGYVPRKKNEILARLLDGGKMLYGKVAEVEFSEYSSWITITVKIYMKDL
jgi:hypothetical protein